MKNVDEYTRDIEIAKNALKETLIDDVVKDRKLLCDVYCIPSHNHQAFYLQVYDGEEYALIFAKSCIWNGVRGCVVMYPFEWTIKADAHPAARGNIYCGIKYVTRNDQTLQKLMKCLPTNDEYSSVGAYIDGCTTLIRNYRLSNTPLLEYKDAENIKHLSLTSEQISFMDDLYIHIENIIGNIGKTIEG